MMTVESRDKADVATDTNVLFVDLDHTLIKTDLLVEMVAKAAKHHPWKLLQAIWCGVQGRAAFKAALTQIVSPEPSALPYRQDLLEFITQQQESGVKLVLATASPRRWAVPIADYLGLFADVLATAGDNNLKGTKKLRAIQQYMTNEPDATWGYIGDSTADLPLFESADRAYLVTASRRLEKKADNAAYGQLSVFRQHKATLGDVLKAMRPHQWVKNVLIFVPMVLAHAFTVTQFTSALLAFISFSCVASGVYLLNDMLDVEADRRHPRKCRRPFASGRLSLLAGMPLFLGLFATGATIAVATLPPKFVLLLAAYLVLTTLYSFYLKNKLILDVMVLAGLYTLRVIAGGAAVNEPVSEWLMAFSIFLFTSLAFAKRYAELTRVRDNVRSSRDALTDGSATDSLFERQIAAVEVNSATRLHGRSYRIEDVGLIESLGPTSGYLSVLVLALYISSPQVSTLYRNGSVLWYVCPLVMYWITRLWFVAKRGKLSEDPIVFALRDGVSLSTGALVAAVMMIAIIT
jgi:4-hydroxybenzoate polyprenyltransferase/phosphoserine phosphatase